MINTIPLYFFFVRFDHYESGGKGGLRFKNKRPKGHNSLHSTSQGIATCANGELLEIDDGKKKGKHALGCSGGICYPN